MGTPKQLLPYHGQPLLGHAARVALDAGCSPVVVVLGAEAAMLAPVLDGLGVTIVVNDAWADGVGTSIRAGLRVIDALDEVTGAIIGLADQPLVTPAAIARLIGRFRRQSTSVVASRYADTLGVPACFGRAMFARLATLGPGEGCKRVIMECAERDVIDCPEAAVDIDTTLDYRQVLALDWR